MKISRRNFLNILPATIIGIAVLPSVAPKPAEDQTKKTDQPIIVHAKKMTISAPSDISSASYMYVSSASCMSYHMPSYLFEADLRFERKDEQKS